MLELNIILILAVLKDALGIDVFNLIEYSTSVKIENESVVLAVPVVYFLTALAMGRARFLLYPWFNFGFAGHQPQTFAQPNRQQDLKIKLRLRHLMISSGLDVEATSESGQQVRGKLSFKGPFKYFKTLFTRGYCLKVLVGVCRPHLQIQTQFQTKRCHFPHPFSDLASKIHTRFQT